MKRACLRVCVVCAKGPGVEEQIPVGGGQMSQRGSKTWTLSLVPTSAL